MLVEGSGPALPEAVRLNREYDVRLLTDDLRALQEAPWAAKRTYSSAPDGRRSDWAAWTCLPLRNQGGDPSRTDPGGPGTADFAATPWLNHAPYLRALLADLPGRLRA